MRVRVLLVLAAAGIGAGCGGDRAAEETAPAAPPAPPALRTAHDPGPGRALVRFVGALQRGDGAALGRLLSRSSHAELAPTPDAFRRNVAELRLGVRGLRPGARVALSLRVGVRRAVASLAGERLVDGEREDFGYAAALVRERGGWRVELGAVVFSGLQPEPNDTLSQPDELRASAAAGGTVTALLLWLDGRPVDARAAVDTPFSASARAEPGTLAPGRHDAVAFAASRDAAGAVAWTFRVGG